MEKNPDAVSEIRDSGVNISDHISKSCVTIFGLKILKFFVNSGSEMENSRSGIPG
jgi:hypothetical protein